MSRYAFQKYLQPLKSPENAGLVDSGTVDEIFYQVSIAQAESRAPWPRLRCFRRERTTRYTYYFHVALVNPPVATATGGNSTSGKSRSPARSLRSRRIYFIWRAELRKTREKRSLTKILPPGGSRDRDQEIVGRATSIHLAPRDGGRGREALLKSPETRSERRLISVIDDIAPRNGQRSIPTLSKSRFGCVPFPSNVNRDPRNCRFARATIDIHDIAFFVSSGKCERVNGINLLNP